MYCQFMICGSQGYELSLKSVKDMNASVKLEFLLVCLFFTILKPW